MRVYSIYSNYLKYFKIIGFYSSINQKSKVIFRISKNRSRVNKLPSRRYPCISILHDLGGVSLRTILDILLVCLLVCSTFYSYLHKPNTGYKIYLHVFVQCNHHSNHLYSSRHLHFQLLYLI